MIQKAKIACTLVVTLSLASCSAGQQTIQQIVNLDPSKFASPKPADSAPTIAPSAQPSSTTVDSPTTTSTPMPVQPSATPTQIPVAISPAVPTSSPTVAPTPSPTQAPAKAASIVSVGKIPRNGTVNGQAASDIGLNDIQILSPTIITASGDFGIAEYSSDGGKSWTDRRFTDNSVYSITQRGTDLVAGRDGGVFIWDTASQSWQLLAALDGAVARITFFDSQNGILMAGTAAAKLYRTSDGGSNWNVVDTIPTGRNGAVKAQITIIDSAAKTAAINADGIVYTYTDGGLQQTTAQLDCCDGKLAFRDNQNGWAYSSGQSYMTADAGQTYTTAKPIAVDGSVLDFARVHALSFGSSLVGMLITGDAAYLTQDGAKTWKPLSLNSSTLAKIDHMKLFVEGNELKGYAYSDSPYVPSFYTLYRISVPLS